MLYKSLDLPTTQQKSAQFNVLSQISIVSKDDFSVHGMASILENSKDKYCVTVTDPDDFTPSVLKALCPDVILINTRITELSVEKMIRSIHNLCPDSSVIIFGHGMKEEFLYQAMRAGARGYLNEKMHGDHLTTAIDTVANGGYWAERHVLCQFISDKSVRAKIDENVAVLNSRLTSRESEVLELILEGLTTNEIADKIYLSHQGVKAHLTNLFRKFEVKNRVQLILAALDLISPVHSLAEIAGKGLKSARCRPKKMIT